MTMPLTCLTLMSRLPAEFLWMLRLCWITVRLDDSTVASTLAMPVAFWMFER